MNFFNTLELDQSSTLKKILSIMRLTTLFLIVFSLNISATVYSQNTKLSLDVRNQSIKEVLYLIENQSDFRFIYESGKINLDKKVSIQAKGQTVETVLKRLFEQEGVQYEITENNLILINPIEKRTNISPKVLQQSRHITGVVKDLSGEPIIGANVVEKGTTNGTVTDINGRFSIDILSHNVLEISYIGYAPKELRITDKSMYDVVLQEDTEMLDEVVVVGYGTQKKVNLTGAIESVNGEQLAKQCGN